MPVKKAAKKTTPPVLKAPTKAVTKFTPTAKLPPLAMLTSWSYSVYTSYMKCPLMVCFDKIKRIKIYEPENPAFIKGNMVHKFADGFVTGQGNAKDIIPELKSMKDRLLLFRKLKAQIEPDWSFTKDWIPTKYNDWANCWLRIKVDAVGVTPKAKKVPALVQIVDWKTGKVYDDHKQQRSLYALGAMQLIEHGLLAGGDQNAKLVVEHAYTDTTQTATEEYTMKDFKSLKNEWLTRVKQMMSDTRYPAKTGYHCRYCKFRKSNGGPCHEDQ